MISVLQFLNDVQLLNATCAATVSYFFLGLATEAAAIVLVTAIFSVTKIYASE